MGAKAYIGPFEAEYTFLEGKFSIYPRSPKTKSETIENKNSGYSLIYDSDSYSEISVQEYESNFKGSAYPANAVSNVLLSDVFLAADPVLASNGTDTVMLYLDSDLERGASRTRPSAAPRQVGG